MKQTSHLHYLLFKTKPVRVTKLILDCNANINTNVDRRQSIKIKPKENEKSNQSNYQKGFPLTHNNQCQSHKCSRQKDTKLNDSLFDDYQDIIDFTSLTEHNHEHKSINYNQPLLTKRTQYAQTPLTLTLSNEILQKAVNVNSNYCFYNDQLPLIQLTEPTLLPQLPKTKKSKQLYYANIHCNNKKLIQIKKLFKQALYNYNNNLIYNNNPY